MAQTIKQIHAFNDLPWLIAATCERTGGVSEHPFFSLNTARGVNDIDTAVTENRKRVLESFSLQNTALLPMNPNHGTEIAVISKEQPALPSTPHDAAILTVPGYTILISSADCPIIFFADTKRKIAAMAHAGWKGVNANIAAKVVHKLQELGSNPKDLLVAISPSIGPCCYRFKDPIQHNDPQWQPFLSTGEDELTAIDLWSMIEHQLIEAGIQKENIHNPKICTACNLDRFFSYRKENPTGRFPSVISLV